MGGPSSEAKANEAAQTDFYKSTTQQQATTFSEQQDLHNAVMAATVPIIQKGPLQYGFTPEVDALLRSTITDSSAKATANAITATQQREKQATGGTDLLGAGGEAQLEATEDVLGEQSKATNLANEKLAGYQAGTQLYTTALSSLSGVTGNPVQYTQAATGAGSNATSAINLADSERSTLLSSLLGGAIKGGLALGTGGIAKAGGITPYGG